MKLPQIKKRIHKFLLDETGKISKQSLLKIGIGVAMFAGASPPVDAVSFSGHDWATSPSWTWKTDNFEHCSFFEQQDDDAYCKATLSGSTLTNSADWLVFKDKIEGGFTNNHCYLNQVRKFTLFPPTPDNLILKTKAEFWIETNMGEFHAVGPSNHVNHWNWEETTRSSSSTTSIKDPAGLHENSISLNATDSNTKISALHENAVFPIDLTFKQYAWQHDNC